MKLLLREIFMKRCLFVLIWTCLLCVGNGWGQDQEQRTEPRRPDINIDPEVLDQQSNWQLLELMELYRQQSLPAQTLSVGELLLERSLTEDQRLDTLNSLAGAYEAIDEDWAGPEARRCYQQILAEFPDANCADKIALRLGELYDHIIRPGTEPDTAKAESFFKRITESYQRDKRPDKTTDLVVLRAYMHLGNLYARQGRYGPSDICYQTIYDCDPNGITAENREYQEALKEFRALRLVVSSHLLSNCIRPKPEDTLAQFARLEQLYADDVELMESLYVRKQNYLDRINQRSTELQERILREQ